MKNEGRFYFFLVTQACPIEREVIGFRPTPKRKNTYSLSRAKSRNGITISGKSLLKYFKIDYKQKRNYIPVWNDEEELVEIELNNPI